MQNLEDEFEWDEQKNILNQKKQRHSPYDGRKNEREKYI